MAEGALRLAEIEDPDFAVGAQDAVNLAKAGIVIREVAETEGGGEQVEYALLMDGNA